MKKDLPKIDKSFQVGVAGFEPTTPCSQSINTHTFLFCDNTLIVLIISKINDIFIDVYSLLFVYFVYICAHFVHIFYSQLIPNTYGMYYYFLLRQ